MAILTGNKENLTLIDDSNSTRKVLESNQESSVFLYFSDHGAPGFLIFPHDSIYADELEETIKKMHNKTLYKELVMFIEACESGSLF